MSDDQPTPTPPPVFFVARDRARRIGWALEKILQERRLAWRGDEVGMSSVADDADVRLSELAEEARTSVEDVVAGRIRDRERGFLEIPFAVAMAAVASRIEDAAEVEGRRRHTKRGDPEQERVQVEHALTSALARLEAFQSAYDEKTPVLGARSVDVGRILTRVSPHWEPVFDRPPSPLHTEPHALEDLLLSVRAALPDAEGPWQIERPGPTRPLTIALGCDDGIAEVVEVPAGVARAADVLTFRTATVLTMLAEESEEGEARLCGIRLALGEVTGASLDTTLSILAGPDAVLSAEAQAAIEALLSAEPHPGAAAPLPVPPARLLALHGVLQQLERELVGPLVRRLAESTAQFRAGAIPREKTRKAPIKKALEKALGTAWPGLDAGRLGELAKAVQTKRLKAKDVGFAEAAVLLAVFGRTSYPGGFRLEQAIEFAPLTEGDVAALVAEILDVEAGRRALHAAPTIDPTILTRMECGAIAALGKLGRLDQAD